MIPCVFVQNGLTSWPGQRQVIVPSWQTLSGIAPQSSLQHQLMADMTQRLPDSWHQSLVLDNIDSAIGALPLVSVTLHFARQQFFWGCGVYKCCNQNSLFWYLDSKYNYMHFLFKFIVSVFLCRIIVKIIYQSYCAGFVAFVLILLYDDNVLILDSYHVVLLQNDDHLYALL